MKTKPSIIAAATSAALLMGSMAFAGSGHYHGESAWTYEGATGPEHWGDLKKEYVLCKTGQSQSPIDITGSTQANPPSLDVQYKPNAGTSSLKVKNNGHTIKVTDDAANRIKIDGKPYKLLQFHFHTPSEHRIDGKAAPMEVHLVHQNPKKELAVIGVMINEGKESAALKAIWDDMPEEAGDKEKVKVKGFDASAFLPENREFFHYAGSLTTPPCSEQVRWFVMKNPIEFAKDQIDKFKGTIGHSIRPVQPLNGRDIFAK